MDNTPAILLRKTKLTETSLVLSWFTRDAGRLKTVAKGARSMKSRFAGVLDLFYECEIQIARSRKSDLHILREAALREARANLRLDYVRVMVAGYFVELLELVTEPEHPAPELFDLLRRALNYLDSKAPDQRGVEHFERELARLLGILRPDVSAAVAITRAYHELPGSRRKVMELLPGAPPRDGRD